MEEELIEILSTLGYPIKRQGSILESEPYPGSFFTFWNNGSRSESFYNNSEHRYIWDFDLNFYSVDPDLIYTILLQAINLLKSNGWITDGKGYDVMSDEITHTGRGINIIKIERED